MKPEFRSDPALFPRDAVSGEPLPASPQPGYYPGFSTLSQSRFWDQATRKVVIERVDQTPAREFFSSEQWRFWEAVFEHIMPQTDRTRERRIPIVGPLDRRLSENRTVGYRFEDMPQDRIAYSLGMQAINAEANHHYGGEFLMLPHLQQDLVLQVIHDGKPEAAAEVWERMSVHRFWQLLMQDAIDAYYAHPWAWDEIGFGGPAYPRAYTRLERGEPEPWEVEERRYEWIAPAFTVSDEVDPVPEFHIESEQHRSHNQTRSHRRPR